MLDRGFDQAEAKRFVVSDLAYVKVRQRWHYVCVLIDLFNRGDLSQIQWFHTDRGSEFKNQKMDELLETFEIGRSFKREGLPL
ncbi:Integrase core domain protein [compost metagenome]